MINEIIPQNINLSLSVFCCNPRSLNFCIKPTIKTANEIIIKPRIIKTYTNRPPRLVIRGCKLIPSFKGRYRIKAKKAVRAAILRGLIKNLTSNRPFPASRRLEVEVVQVQVYQLSVHWLS